MDTRSSLLGISGNWKLYLSGVLKAVTRCSVKINSEIHYCRRGNYHKLIETTRRNRIELHKFCPWFLITPVSMGRISIFPISWKICSFFCGRRNGRGTQSVKVSLNAQYALRLNFLILSAPCRGGAKTKADWNARRKWWGITTGLETFSRT